MAGAILAGVVGALLVAVCLLYRRSRSHAHQLEEKHAALEQEIIERRAMEHHLQSALLAAENERRRTEAFLEAIGDGISIQDTNFTIVYQNRAHRRMFGELVGRSCAGLYSDGGAPCADCPLGKPAAEVRLRRRECLVHGPGGPMFLEISSSPLVDKGGRVDGCIGIVHDISQRRRISLAINMVAEGTSGVVGQDFFVSVVRNLAGALGYRYAFLATWNPDNDRDLEVLAFWNGNHFLDNAPVTVAGSPWEQIMATRAGLRLEPASAPLFPGHAVYGDIVAREVCGVPVRDSSDAVIGVLAVFHDAARPPDAAYFDILRLFASRAGAEIERLRMERERQVLQGQLLQAQKMESIGILAGGVAHDFNNLLSTIIGYGQMLLRRLDPDSPFRAEIEAINTAGRRAAQLTRQLLAFSRKQVLEIQRIDVNAVIGGVAKMLRRLIGEHIDFELDLAPQLPPIMADAGQLEQVLMNLVVNARDAMPEGGSLIIRTGTGRPPARLCGQHPALAETDCVTIEVSDTGSGIPPELQDKIFEPFFTTKPQGKGTGLGLATVYGIVRQHNGLIEVSSTPGAGSRFTIFLPRARGGLERQEESTAPAPARRAGRETILVAEDEFLVRHFLEDCLRAEGYDVLVAADGAEAFELSKQAEQIDLVLTDVVMPKMNGRELAARVTSRFPKAKVLYLSGYSEQVLEGIPADELKRVLVKKPVSPDQLAARVRQLLDEKDEG